jgi:hypothetical protein
MDDCLVIGLVEFKICSLFKNTRERVKMFSLSIIKIFSLSWERINQSRRLSQILSIVSFHAQVERFQQDIARTNTRWNKPRFIVA